MSELDEKFAALAADADLLTVAPAAELRTRTDRRARTRAVVATLAVALVVGGTATSGRWLFSAGPTAPHLPATSTPVTTPPSTTAVPPPVDPTPSTSTKPTGTTPSDPTPPTSRTPVGSKVPDRAFLTASETHGPKPYPVDSEDMLPDLCGARMPGEDVLQQRRTMHVLYKGPNTPSDNVPDGTVQQTISVYGNGGAADYVRGRGPAVDYVREFRAAVRACPKTVKGDVTCRLQLLADPNLGDEAALLERVCVVDVAPGEFGAGEHRARTAVVRFGETVTVLDFQGWEGASVDPAETTPLTRQAAQRVENWLG
ncbi:hypothetical protein [Krasilnikovia sp. MM14-A1004]|uniref:hypothetical protein n=1 Tax=Krasilnikovia sp. MM14-A1004 TaxID=3373541 RepID=UPI00399CA216